MRNRKSKAKRKPRTVKKYHSPKSVLKSQPDATASLSPDRIAARLTEASMRNDPNLVGEEIVRQLGKLVESSTHESPDVVRQAVERIVNRLVEVLQTIEVNTADEKLRNVAQEQLIYSARRFSDTAFAVLDRTPKHASEIMTLSLVKYITGQCDSLKKACAESPQTFRWIAEQNVFWPSIRGLNDTFHDNFSDIKSNQNLAGRLPINRNPKRAPDMNKAAYQEVVRFLIMAPHAHDWPDLPQLSRDKRIMAAWKKRLLLYLDVRKKRLLKSPEFTYVKTRDRVKGKNDTGALTWDQIKKDCAQVLRSLAPARASRK